jgi:hypothetical protein
MRREKAIEQGKKMIAYLEKEREEDKIKYIDKEMGDINSSWWRKLFGKQMSREEVIAYLEKSDREYILFYKGKYFSRQYGYCVDLVSLLENIENSETDAKYVGLTEDNCRYLGLM